MEKMKLAVVVAAVLLCGGDRITATDGDVKRPIEEAVEAINRRDMDGLLQQWTKGKQATVRKCAAATFAAGGVQMTLEGCAVSKKGATTAEVDARYRINGAPVTAKLKMRYEENYWRLYSEKTTGPMPWCHPSRQQLLPGDPGNDTDAIYQHSR